VKPPRVFVISRPCDVGGERYRVAKLEDDTYVFIRGHVRVDLRQPLPIDSGGMIDEPCDLPILRTKWTGVVAKFRNRGDHESANTLRATWNDFDRDVTAVQLPKRVPQII
jgi:hypothetical protein